MDCGPTCLRMISRFYGKHYSLETIRQITGFNKAGSSLLGISEAAEKLGFRTRAVKISYDQLISEANFPCLLHWNQEHFVVMLPLSKWGINRRISIADPAKGILSFSQLMIFFSLDNIFPSQQIDDNIIANIIINPLNSTKLFFSLFIFLFFKIVIFLFIKF